MVWVKQNLVVRQGLRVSECRRGRIVGLVLPGRERGSERLIPEPPATVTSHWVCNLQSFQIDAAHP